ncbi:MAG TPA: c-type cytochrome [Burkholderiaceae bacterium]|jgi:cytochrome c|nr:c-type cytochrome [Burkholderiaceae bacterium]
MIRSIFSFSLARNVWPSVIVAGLLVFQSTLSFGEEQKAGTAVCSDTALNRVIGQCMACHSVKKGEAHLTGPNLYKVYGRQAGNVRGFNFTSDLKAAKFKWDDEKLDRFLSDPRSLFPNTAMAFGGVEKESERAALICYFRSQTKR